MIRMRAQAILVAAVIVEAAFSGRASAGGIEECGATGTAPAAPIPILATPYRSGVLGQHYRYREVEFIWDAAYTPSLTTGVRQTLDNFGVHLADELSTSPLVTDAFNTEALYLYLNRAGRGWNLSPGVFNASMQLGDASYAPPDYSHADAYITP